MWMRRMVISSREGIAIAVGLVVASIIPAFVLAAIWPLNGYHDPESILVSFAILFPFSFFFAVLLGLPTLFLLRRWAPGHWWMAAGIGFALGMLVPAILIWNLP